MSSSGCVISEGLGETGEVLKEPFIRWDRRGPTSLDEENPTVEGRRDCVDDSREVNAVKSFYFLVKGRV